MRLLTTRSSIVLCTLPALVAGAALQTDDELNAAATYTIAPRLCAVCTDDESNWPEIEHTFGGVNNLALVFRTTPTFADPLEGDSEAFPEDGSAEYPVLGETGQTRHCEQGINCHEEYWEDACNDWHGPCGGESLDAAGLASVMSAVAAGDDRTLRALMRQHSTLSFNADRGAVQVLDCRKNVVAHLPVGASLADALDD